MRLPEGVRVKYVDRPMQLAMTLIAMMISQTATVDDVADDDE